jgi:O-antigen/teichoic acid export membrane protein
MLKRLVRHRLVRGAASSIGLSGIGLLMSIVSGIIVARVLNTSGRGELTAIVTITSTIGWLTSVGCRGSITYHLAKDPALTPALIATWLRLMLGLAIVGTIIVEGLLPLLLAAQSPQTLEAARLYALSLIGIVGTELAAGLLLGRQAFALGSFLRIAAPLGITVMYIVLAGLGALTVGTALGVNAVAYTAPPAITLLFAIRRSPPSAFSRDVAVSTLSYGLRGFVSSFGDLLNARLDLMLMPAFLRASQVGVYAVAGTLSSVFAVLGNSLSAFLLSATSGASETQRTRAVLATARVTLIAGAVLAVLLGVIAPQLIDVMYGHNFVKAGTYLRLLLPGAVLYATGFTLVAGLYSMGRPSRSAVPQTIGLVVTVVGLGLFLRRYGPAAASLVSTAAYATVFVVAAALFRRSARLSWREMIWHQREAAVDDEALPDDPAS